MASNSRSNSNSSPRDHDADANPDRARKKQRIAQHDSSASSPGTPPHVEADPPPDQSSNSPHEPRGSSPDTPILIEAGPPEHQGSNFQDIITIEDDPYPIMDSYSESFVINSLRGSPMEQVSYLHGQLAANFYIDANDFISLARSLRDHLQSTADEPHAWAQRYLDDEADFFNKLADLFTALLEGPDMFEPKSQWNRAQMRQALTTFLFDLQTLCRRIIPHLPQAIKATVSRRDSGQFATRTQTLGALQYLFLAYRILIFDPFLAVYLHRVEPQPDLNRILEQNTNHFFTNDLVHSLATIIRVLGGAMRELKNSWTALQSSLELFAIAVDKHHLRGDYPQAEVEEVLGVLHTCILPAICAKHPGSLPHNFHGRAVELGLSNIQMLALSNSTDTAESVYEHFVKSDIDSLLPHDTSTDHSTALWRLVDKSQADLAQLLALSWAMQAYLQFIYSDVMDVRNAGITLLKKRLVDLYNTGQNSPQGHEHPFTQYGVRFLRENEVTGYIFGPQSRATLVGHSDNIVCFLAATGFHTEVETDIIWNACSTSVEADFVNASFSILERVMTWLSFQQLIYIAQKYTTTPADKLGTESVRFFEQLLIHINHVLPDDQSSNLVLASTIIEILKITSTSPACASVNEIRRLSMTVIAQFAQPGVSLNDKAEIYGQCIPDIQKRSPHATASAEILAHLLHVRVQPFEADLILGMLPVDAAVDELCCFIRDRNGNDMTASYSPDVIVRLDCIVHLIILDRNAPAQEMTDKLFDHVFGHLALCNTARDQAWLKLMEFAQRRATATTADELWRGYTEKRIPELDASFATPALLTFIGVSLKDEIASEKTQSDSPSLLSLPLWKTLVRIATSATEDEVVNSSVHLILDLLFAQPTSAPETLLRCQCEFVRSHIQDLCHECADLMAKDQTAAAQRFARGIKILKAVLVRSKETPATSIGSETTDVLVLATEGSVVTFAAQVYGATAQPKFLQIRATPDTQISEVLAKLPEKTLASENRIIVGGQEVSLQPHRTLRDAGIQPSGVIMISPKYTFQLDLDKVLTGLGPVEQVVVSQYESLERFLDGPGEIAEQAFHFLLNVCTSAQARMKVTSPTATVEELFPPGRPWRTRLSLKTLQRHLFEFSKLGVADQDFISRSLRLLVAVVLDHGRPFDPLTTFEVAKSLCVFFQAVSRKQSPNSQLNGAITEDHNTQIEEAIPHLDEPTTFITRMMVLMFEGLTLPLGGAITINRTSLRTGVITTLYRALLEACRAHSSLWKLVAQHHTILGLHQCLLLDDDADLSQRMADRIRDLCRDSDTPHMVHTAYWSLIVPNISYAMAKGPLCEPYFNLMSDILPLVDRTENDLRAWIETFTMELRSCRHTETPRIMMKDHAVAGLLKNLGLLVTYLKSYKKPLQLNGLSTELMQQFLFGDHTDAANPPLTNEESRNLVFDLARWTFEPPADYHELVDLLHGSMQYAYRDVGFRFPGFAEFCRAPWDGAGLLNLGMTCYMNSLLQQLFANLQFRKFILDQPTSTQQRQEVLLWTQSLFAYMQNHTAPFIVTENLAKALKIQTGMQEDVHTFYTTLLSRLEEGIEGSDNKAALAKFFTGKSITQIKGECGHVSSRTEPFTELSITVKNKTGLVESLDEFVQGEPLEGANKYRCMTCDAADGGRLINAVKRTCLEEVPDNLTCCLKRFTYGLEGEDKVNDLFEFPSVIDMAVYKRNYLENPDAEREPDIFELVGVIVHQGSLQFGHYWSYVRVAGTKDQWMILEDMKMMHCKEGLQDVQKACFGGPKWSNGMDRSDSAYVLFYQRRSYMDEAISINKVPVGLQRRFNVLPEVDLPEGMAKDIETANASRQLASSFFGNGFNDFMVWIIGQLPRVLLARKTDRKDTDDATSPNEADTSSADTETLLGLLIAEYMKRILIAHPQAEFKVDAFMTAVDTVIDYSPATARAILHGLSDRDGFAWTNIVCHDHAKVRSQFFKPIEKCLSVVRELGVEIQDRSASSLITSATSIIGYRLNLSRGRWTEYLAFVTRLAGLEDGLLLERGYLEWALEIISMRCYDTESRKRHLDLWTWMKSNPLDLGPLYEFIFTILNESIDLLTNGGHPAYATNRRARSANGWVLRGYELNLLVRCCTSKGSEIWGMLFAAANHTNIPERWQDYAPGKLLGLLVSEYTNADLARFSKQMLANYFNYEEIKIMPMLMLALHFFQNREDADCQATMHTLNRNLLLWRDSEQDCLWFYEQASAPDMAPLSVMGVVASFASTFLGCENPLARQKTAAFLRDAVFTPPPLSDHPNLDAARARATRPLFDSLQKTVRAAYREERRRGHFESTMETLQQAKGYMTRLIAAVRKATEDDQDIPQGLRIEADEMPAALAGLNTVLDELQDWEQETTLPTRLHVGDVRASVEMESDGYGDAVVGETSDDELSTSDLGEL